MSDAGLHYTQHDMTARRLVHAVLRITSILALFSLGMHAFVNPTSMCTRATNI